MANNTAWIITTTNSNDGWTTSTSSSVLSHFFSFVSFTNLWYNVGFVAVVALVLGCSLWLLSCLCCRSKLSQQESWCWCLCCCPDIELPLVKTLGKQNVAHAPIQAWTPPTVADPAIQTQGNNVQYSMA